MASLVYTEACEQFANGNIDWENDTIRIRLCMTNTTCDTEEDVATLSAFTTIDLHDGANYPSPDTTLTTTAAAADATNNRATMDATDVTYTSLGAGTRTVAGVLVYKFVTNDTDSIPICWHEEAFTPNGGNITISWNAAGVLTLDAP